MRILILGGTRLSGPFLVRQLLGLGHHVMVYHRGNNRQNVPAGVDQILAPPHEGPDNDRYHLEQFAGPFRAARPDVVVHMIAFTREDAEAFVSVFAGVAARAVVARRRCAAALGLCTAAGASAAGRIVILGRACGSL
jgi:nucleoside-diphosphate-sugar epimerase